MANFITMTITNSFYKPHRTGVLLLNSEKILQALHCRQHAVTVMRTIKAQHGVLTFIFWLHLHIKPLTGPSLPHLCFCLHARIWLLYFIRSLSKRRKITVKLPKIIKPTLRNTAYSRAITIRFTMLLFPSVSVKVMDIYLALRDSVTIHHYTSHLHLGE